VNAHRERERLRWEQKKRNMKKGKRRARHV
jgi:hypothetical protein